MNDIPQTRATLILRLQNADDAEAWEEFAEIYQPLIFRLAKSKGLQSADASDVVQEVLTRIASAINRFNPNPEVGTFRGWISRITRNLLIDFLRSKQRMLANSDEASVADLAERSPARSAETDLFDIEHERQLFHWAAAKSKDSFTESTWQAFWLTAVRSLSIEDASKQLEISKGAVYIARSRVMAKLKKTIEATHFDSGEYPLENSHE